MTKTDVLYIHPIGNNPSFSLKYFNEQNKNNSSHYFGFIPMGIIGICNNLITHGISVKGINLALKKRVDPNFDLEKYIKENNPRIVLIDVHWYVHIKDGIEIAKICKKLLGCEVIVGGLSATLFYKQLLETHAVDYVVKGDAEKPILGLVKSILIGKEIKIENVASKKFDSEIGYCVFDIDKYDYLNLDFLEDRESYFNMFDTWLLVGKGCPYECKNCDGAKYATENIFKRGKTIFRNPKKLVNDLKKVQSQSVNFSLDLDLIPNEMINAISNHRFNFNLRNEFFQLIDVRKLRKIKNSFNSFDLVFSPTSGNDKERNEYGKNFTNAEFLEGLKKIEEEDVNGGIIVYFTDYMISPVEVKKLDVRARDELIKKIEEITPYALIKVLPQVVDPGRLVGKLNVEDVFKHYSK